MRRRLNGMQRPLTHSQRGSILIMTALGLTTMLAMTALAIDAAYMYDTRNRMGAAADAAALAASQELKRGGPGVNLFTFANSQLAMHGVPLSTACGASSGTSLCVYSPPISGPFTGVEKYVEVVVTQPVPTFFARLLGTSTMTVGSRSVAGPGDASGCIFALNQADPKWPIELDFGGTNPTVIDVPKCGIYSNGNFNVDAGNTVNAKEIDIHAATGTVNGIVAPPPVYSFPVVADPLGDMDQVATFNTMANGWNGTSWTCGWTGQKNKGGVITNLTSTTNFINGTLASQDTAASYILNPGVYCGDGSTEGITATLTNDPAYTVHFNPGVYIINGGGANWKHCYVNGAGVTFYFTGTTTTHDYQACGQKILDTDAPLNLQLSAPTSGTYEGLLMIQDRAQATACSLNPVIANFKPADMTINGTIYFPNHHIAYGATTSSSGKYTILIGGTIFIQGKATLNSDFVGAGLSGSPLKRSSTAE